MSEPHFKPPQHAAVPEERRATEYLANERTFLAWIRTSIAVISLGFVIGRFAVWFRRMTPGNESKPEHVGASLMVGVAMMALGALLAILAVWRYHIVNHAIDEGRVKADRGLVILVTVLVVLLATGMIAFMLVTD
jgi:putative membrane protein